MTTIIEDGAVFDGSDQADSIAVLANGARVNAGQGDDWISAILDVTADPDQDADGDGYPDAQEVTTDLRGDDGDDRIHASLRGVDDTFYVLSLAALLSGGAGNDQIWLDIYNYQAPFEATVSGGAGADDIRVTALGEGDSTFGGGSVAVDAGRGDDQVLVDVTGRAEGGVTVDAGSGNDFVQASAWFIGPDGNGSGTADLFGGSGDDTLNGGARINNAEGGSGNDEIALDGTRNGASGDDGNDGIKATAAVDSDANGGVGFAENTAYGGSGNDTIRGTLDFFYSGFGTNELHGGDGDDRLISTISFDLSPDPSSDEYPLSGEAKSLIYGDGGDDRITVRVTGNVEDGEFSISSELYGGSGNDRLSVRGGEGNVLDGGSGADVLLGSEGVDILDGGGHADYMRGRDGADIFRFEIGDSSARNRDRIADFEIGSDVIDLSQIDANVARRGDQAFIVDGAEGRGHAWFVEDPDSTGTILVADNGRRVLEVLLIDGRGVEADHYSASDFLL